MSPRQQLVFEVAELLQSDKHVDAGKLVAQFSGIPAKSITTEQQSLELLFSLLKWCLENDHYEWGARLLWGPGLFTPEPQCTQDVWRVLKTSQAAMFMGAASMSKSYAGGVWLLLDWIRDPEYTSVIIVGPSEDHLKDNLFTHLVTLHRESKLPLPGIVGDLFIGLDPRARKSAIRGVVIPLGKKASGRLVGRKRVPRPRGRAHPKFGPLSRMRIFVDEAEKVPMGVWKDIDNVFSQMDGDVEGFKLAMAFNPEDIAGPVGQRCEPPEGWEKFDLEVSKEWVSKRGWRVLRLDAAKCENVVQRKVIFPGLQTYEGFTNIIQNAGGTDTPGYYSMCRGAFPKSGAIYTVMSPTLVFRMQGEFLFAEPPHVVAACDLALEGGDAAEFALGRYGLAAGIRRPPTPEFPHGQEVLFQDKQGRRVLRHGIQVDQIYALPPGDTVAMAERVKAECLKHGVLPAWLMLDRTGNGAGVHDLLKSLWSQDVLGVNYSESATDGRMFEEDTQTAKELYDRAVTELWFALKRYAEFGFVLLSTAAFQDELVEQITKRRLHRGKLNRVEDKKEYKDRSNGSPNKADVLTLVVHGVRRAANLVPKAVDDVAGSSIGGGSGGDGAPVPCFIDSSSRFVDIDTPDSPSGGSLEVSYDDEWRYQNPPVDLDGVY